MILDLLPKLSQFQFVLASASPRRKEILSSIGLQPLIQPSKFAENLDKSKYTASELWRYALDTARCKALDVASQTLSEQAFVIAADTIVTQDGVILEKPSDAKHAFEMIKMLSGRQSFVHTGVVIVPPKSLSSPVIELHETTRVCFAELDDSLIEAYVKTGEPFDKAGGYGYQGLAGSLIQGIDGCYYNVVGFPLHSFCAALRKLVLV